MLKNLQNIIAKIKGDCEDFASKCTNDEVAVTVIIGGIAIGLGILFVYFI